MLRKRGSVSETIHDPEEVNYPITPPIAIKQFKDQLTMHELGEILDYFKIYFLGIGSAKIKTSHNLPNYGFDDENGDYIPVITDQLAYRYEILQVIGKGSFGQVLKCFDHKEKEFVAIKIIKNKKRFHQQGVIELKILDYILKYDSEDKHHLVHYKEYFMFRKHLCISFEMLSFNLYELLKSNSFEGLSLSIVRNITMQILSGLVFMHQHRIIHCDLKPENILMIKPGRSGVKLIDFGSSCFENERLYTYIQSRFYRAPEIILGIPYKMSIDMWSLGCIIAELIQGYPLFPGENEQEQLLCQMEMLGIPPTHIIEMSPKKNDYFNGKEPKIVPNSHGRIRNPSSRSLSEKINCTNNEILDLILSKFYLECLNWDPYFRITPEEAFKHPWINCKYR